MKSKHGERAKYHGKGLKVGERFTDNYQRLIKHHHIIVLIRRHWREHLKRKTATEARDD